MKIAALLWDNIFKTGGREVFTINLLSRLAERGNDVTVYVPEREKRKRADMYASLPFKARFFPYWQRFSWSYFPEALHVWLGFQQRKHGYQLWQGMGAYPESYLLSKMSVPCVVRMYGEDIQIQEGLEYGVRRDPVVRERIRQGMANLDGVMAMTPSLAHDALEAGAAVESINGVPNAIDFERLQGSRGARLRERYGLSDDTLILLTVGRNHIKKGFDLIPSIGSKLVSEKWCWFVVGAGTEDLQGEINDFGLSKKIIPLPSIQSNEIDFRQGILSVPPQALIDVFAESDIFVLPSRIEGYSRVIAEAMGAGLPIVTTDAPGCGEVFTHGVEGLISPVDDIVGMAAQVDQLTNDTSLRMEISNNAIDAARELDWDCIVDRYIQVYRKLVE
jgi:glycosyltransferase involved in cell wall biosynthesis